jgi:hypothetical protein
MKTIKYSILVVAAFVLIAGLLAHANSKGGSPAENEIQSLKEDLVKTCNKEISTIGKITDRRAFLEGVFFAQRVVDRIRNEGVLISLNTRSDCKEILRGIFSIQVIVESMNPEIEKYGLTDQLLQTDTELHLRTHGIKVAANMQCQDEKVFEQNAAHNILRLWECGNEAKSDEDFLQSAIEWVRRNHFETYQFSGQLPTLYINVNTVIHEERRIAAFEISVELQEGAYLCRNSAPVADAPVWKKAAIATCSTNDLKEYTRELLKDFLDEFINDYFAANPKDYPSKETQ